MHMNISSKPSVNLLEKLVNIVSAQGRRVFSRPSVAFVGADGLSQLATELLSSRGEASGRALSVRLLDAYADAAEEDRHSFFVFLLDSLGFDEEKIGIATRSYLKSPVPEVLDKLIELLEPNRQELLRRLNVAPGGTPRLLQMREDLLRFSRKNVALKRVDADFRHVFSSWFNQGFLELRRIDWDTPAAVLEKIIRYEAVHSINDWDDLRRRTDPGDRRLYAFFHPAIPDDPLIFVEVALMHEIPGAVGPILAVDRTVIDPLTAKTAVFYSISNCQIGLRGVSFGSFLIKQVAETLKKEFSGLETFATLSPIPGFSAWLKKLDNGQLTVLVDNYLEAVTAVKSNPDHAASDKMLNAAKVELMPLMAFYLAEAKADNGLPVDPVARFHLGNGARLHSLNWMADDSEKALQSACGMMVNYHYDLPNVEKNHEAFRNEGAIDVAPQVSKWLGSRAATLSMVRLPETRLLR